MKYIPRQYQLEGKNFLQSRKYAMLGDAPGVGKTGQAILASDPAWRILTVCPASVKEQWKQAWRDWAGMTSCVWDPKNGHFREPVYIINYDRIFRPEYLNWALKFKWDLIIFDEAHKLKNMKAKRTKAALSKSGLRSVTKRIWFLTGTPVKNRTIDFYPILRSCAPEVLGNYDSYLKFVYRYCGAYKGRFGLDVSGASHTDELANRLNPFMLRREKRDVLKELPPRIVSKIDLPCTPEVKRIIEEEENKTIEYAGEEDPSKFKLGEIARIRQAVAKYKVDTSYNYISDLLEEEEKIVVFYYHKEVLNALQRRFQKIPSVFIDGSVSPSKRMGIVEKFAKDKNVRLFFGQMEACGEGIDGLQASSSTCVFVEPSWSHTDIEQCVGRLERSGQRNDVNVHILVIKDTLESRMMDTVAQKIRVDKKLYKQEQKQNKGEKKMPPKKETELLERLAVAVETIANAITSEQAAPKQAAPKQEAPKQKPKEVAPAEPEVTEDDIRKAAEKICKLRPDGSAKLAVAELVKKVGGGKIADLKTDIMKKAVLSGIEELHKQFVAGNADDL